jgi:hypothetical protein
MGLLSLFMVHGWFMGTVLLFLALFWRTQENRPHEGLKQQQQEQLAL